jgi:truncated hemoglobin YjbI
MDEPSMVFSSGDREIRVNFGVMIGREVTAAEVDELARELHARVNSFSIVAEQRYEFAGDVEAAVHQVKIEIESPIDEEFRGRLLEIAERWADACAAERTLQLPTG